MWPILKNTMAKFYQKNDITALRKLNSRTIGSVFNFRITLQILKYTLKKILYQHPPKHALLNQLLIKQLNQPYYSVDSTKKFSQNHTV